MRLDWTLYRYSGKGVGVVTRQCSTHQKISLSFILLLFPLIFFMEWNTNMTLERLVA